MTTSVGMVGSRMSVVLGLAEVVVVSVLMLLTLLLAIKLVEFGLVLAIVAVVAESDRLVCAVNAADDVDIVTLAIVTSFVDAVDPEVSVVIELADKVVAAILVGTEDVVDGPLLVALTASVLVTVRVTVAEE